MFRLIKTFAIFSVLLGVVPMASALFRLYEFFFGWARYYLVYEPPHIVFQEVVMQFLIPMGLIGGGAALYLLTLIADHGSASVNEVVPPTTKNS